MAGITKAARTGAMQHPGEEESNDVRRRLAAIEPQALRTYTPSLAVLARSEGCYHWTPEGRKLADFTSGVLVANLGHNPTRWWQRVLDYMGLDKLSSAGDFFMATTLTAYNAVTELEVHASERLIASLQSQPGGNRLEQVVWSASGSEAVQKSIWAALDRRSGEDIILATRRGFHGKKGLSGAVTGTEQDPDRDPRVRFLSFPTEECKNLERRRQPLDLTPYEAELDALWQQYDSRICCLMTEPYLGGGGSYHPQKEYLHLLQQFCRQRDLVFILDEVQANFGRTGSMYAFSEYGVEPDIVVLGKGLGNGIPVDAAVGRADLFANMRYGEASDTWSGSPLGCAAVLATLDEFESTDVLAHARVVPRHRTGPDSPGRPRPCGPRPRRRGGVGHRVGLGRQPSLRQGRRRLRGSLLSGRCRGPRDPFARSPEWQRAARESAAGDAAGRGSRVSRRDVRDLRLRRTTFAERLTPVESSRGFS